MEAKYIFDNEDDKCPNVNKGHIFKNNLNNKNYPKFKRGHVFEVFKGYNFLIEIDTKKVEDNFKNLTSSEAIKLVVKSIFRLKSWEV